MNSFGVQTKARQARSWEAYKIDGVPALGIQGAFTPGQLGRRQEQDAVRPTVLIQARARADQAENRRWRCEGTACQNGVNGA